MKISLPLYNTNTSFALLQVLLYLKDEKEITYQAFEELTTLSKTSYYRVMEMFEEMIEDIHFQATLSKIKLENRLDYTHYQEVIYRFHDLGSNEYDIEGLSDEKKIQYSPVIVYLMLKNRKRVTQDKLKTIFPNFDKDKMAKLIKKLQDVIAEEIDFNPLKSYMLIED